jgi:hypothetical protein
MGKRFFVMLDKLLRGVAIADLETAMERLGLSATLETLPNGTPVLRSAIGGLAFNVRPGGLMASEDGQRHGDFSFNLMVQTEKPVDGNILNEWNRQKRFGRLFQRDDFLVLEMDVLAVGISGDQILASLEIWGRLVVEVLTFLRTAHAPAAGNS